MIHRSELTLPVELPEAIVGQELDVLAELVRVLVNEAMCIERQNYLGTASYQRAVILP